MSEPHRLLFLDLETTSADPDSCEIVEVGLLPLPIGQPWPFPVPVPWAFKVNPGIPIPAEATEIHGITDADVRDEPSFEAYAADVQQLVEGSILVGHNIRTFDSIILDRKLRAAGCAGLLRDPQKSAKIVHPEIDTLELWHRHEPRTLAGLFARFLGGVPAQFEGHRVEDDVMYLPDALLAMAELRGWPALAPRINAPVATLDGLRELCELSVPEGEVDRGGKFLRRADGVVVCNIGEHKGRPAMQVPRSFYEWMLRKDFPEDSKAVARFFIEKQERVWRGRQQG